MEERVKCCGRVLNVHNPYGCSRWAVVSRDGKPYCRQHDPERIKAKQDDKQGFIQHYSGPGLSRDTAIKLVEAATGYLSVMDLMPAPMDNHQDIMKRAIKAAKSELGI